MRRVPYKKRPKRPRVGTRWPGRMFDASSTIEYPFREIFRDAPPRLFIDRKEYADFVPDANDWDTWLGG